MEKYIYKEQNDLHASSQWLRNRPGSALPSLRRIPRIRSTEIGDGFKELEELLCNLPLNDNNAVFNLCCRLCCAYERKAFIDGLLYGAHLMSELR